MLVRVLEDDDVVIDGDCDAHVGTSEAEGKLVGAKGSIIDGVVVGRSGPGVNDGVGVRSVLGVVVGEAVAKRLDVLDEFVASNTAVRLWLSSRLSSPTSDVCPNASTKPSAPTATASKPSLYWVPSWTRKCYAVIYSRDERAEYIM